MNPRAYIDYLSGLGSDNPLIDEARDDNMDNDNDWDSEYDDIGADGIPDTQDYGEGDGQPTHGEPNYDETDVDESDQIGLTSFDYFTPAGDYPMKHDEQLWEKMKPGFFDTPSSIQNGEPIAGEDGDFSAKVKALETLDGYLPELMALSPDVLIVAGDHATPSILASHSWHPVPFLINSKLTAGEGIKAFNEKDCAMGSIGQISATHLMLLALANGDKLTKFGP